MWNEHNGRVGFASDHDNANDKDKDGGQVCNEYVPRSPWCCASATIILEIDTKKKSAFNYRLSSDSALIHPP
jgi:hypothetical protein